MPSATSSACEKATVENNQTKFHQELANGLHAMAQPLTMLRAAIEVLALPQSAGIDRQRYLAISASAVDRTCNVFSRVQDLVAVTSIEAQRVRFDLWNAIRPAIEDRSRLLDASGVAIAAAKAEAWEPVIGDAGRAEQAVAVVLQMAGDLSSRGDVIELSGRAGHGFVELTIENTRRHGKRIDSTARLNLALAEASVASQHGQCEFREDPFRFLLKLPVEDLDRSGNEPVLTYWEPEHLH